MGKLIVGVDAGATKIKAALYDENGKIISQKEGAFANFKVDFKLSIENLVNVLNELLSDTTDVEIIVIGAAGIPKKHQIVEIEKKIENQYKTKVKIVSDALIALYSIKKNTDECPLLVIGGTGSVAMVFNQNEIKQIGGYGHLLGDEGSAYHLVLSLIKEALINNELGKKPTKLEQALLSATNLKEVIDLKHFLYDETKDKVASLAPLVSKYAEKNDTQAIRLLTNEGVFLAHLVQRGIKAAKKCTRFVIGLRGGLLVSSSITQQAMKDEMLKYDFNYRLEKSNADPLNGAYKLAIQLLKGSEQHDG